MFCTSVFLTDNIVDYADSYKHLAVFLFLGYTWSVAATRVDLK